MTQGPLERHGESGAPVSLEGESRDERPGLGGMTVGARSRRRPSGGAAIVALVSSGAGRGGAVAAACCVSKGPFFTVASATSVHAHERLATSLS